MNIEFDKIVCTNQQGTTYENYRVHKFEPCCEKIWRTPGIVCGRFYGQDEYETKLGVFIEYVKFSHSYEDDFIDEYYYKISHCPYCGKELSTQVVVEKDCSEKLLKAQLNIDRMNQILHETDSRSEADQARLDRDDYIKERDELLGDDEYDFFAEIRKSRREDTL